MIRTCTAETNNYNPCSPLKIYEYESRVNHGKVENESGQRERAINLERLKTEGVGGFRVAMGVALKTQGMQNTTGMRPAQRC